MKNLASKMIKKQEVELDLITLKTTKLPYPLKQGDTNVHEIILKLNTEEGFAYERAQVHYSTGDYQDIEGLTFIIKSSALITGTRSFEVEFVSGEEIRRSGKVEYRVVSSISSTVEAYDKYNELKKLYDVYVDAADNEVQREQLKVELIELKNNIERDLKSINLTVDDIVSSEDDRKQNENVREQVRIELENLVIDIQDKLDDGDFVGEKGDKGEQGIQGVKGDTGEVTQEEFDNLSQEVTAHKEEYVNQRQQDQFKVATVEKELNDYKSIMANVNVNQEAKQSVSGYGTISLPKNTANGQVSSTQKGLTVINLLGTNGDFASGTDKLAKGWKISNSSLSHAYDGIEKSQSFNVPCHDNYLYYNLNINNGHKYYIRFLLKKTKEEESKLLIGFGNTIGKVTEDNTTITNDIYNTETYTEINKMLLPTADYSFIGFSGIHAMRSNAKIKDMTLVDLTELFGAGNEPTIDECKQIFNGHISGTKSTISASRLKSVGKNGIQESTLYLPNVGELRSLPNGVRDEIKVSGGKAEHIRRTKTYVLQASDIFGVKTTNVNNDIVNIRKEIFTDIISPGADINATKMNTPITSPRLGRGFDQADNVWTHSFDANNSMLIFVPKGTYSSLADAQSKLTGLELTYQLAEPITTPIEVSGTLLSNPSGTVYVEKVLPVAGIYTDEIAIAHTDFPISSLDKISKVDFATGVETQLDVSKAVVATDKLSFTHTDLTSGDIVFFEYFYANESTLGELELEYYDSRHVLKDSVTGKFYKIIPMVANGVLTNELLEV